MDRSFKLPPKVKLPSPFGRVERDCVQRYLAQAVAFWEFGCGASTQMACSMPHLRDITSIECDATYAKEVSEACPRATVILVDCGDVDSNGWPTQEVLSQFWPRYSQIWSEAEKMYDTVLLAGRFRLACALWICLHPRGVKRMLIANFVDRPEYHALEPFVDVVEVVGTLAVVKPKRVVDRFRCEALYEQSKINPA